MSCWLLAEMRKRSDDEKQLTRAETADFFRVSARTIDYWCAPAGTRFENGMYGRGLPHIKIGHEKRFLLGDLRRFRDQMKGARAP
jgi:hypothetical protein